MERYLLIIIGGLFGAFIALKIQMPGGAVVGSMIGSGIMTLFFPEGVNLTPRTATIIQVLLGISLGMTFDRSIFVIGTKALPLAILSTCILLVVAFLMALLAHKLGLVDFGTALFGFSPGGMTGMAILAKTEGHNTPVVAFFHLVRIFTLFIAVPLLVRLYLYFTSSN